MGQDEHAASLGSSALPRAQYGASPVRTNQADDEIMADGCAVVEAQQDGMYTAGTKHDPTEVTEALANTVIPTPTVPYR